MLNNIYLGDSRELIRNIDSNMVHAIISDIPYGIGYDDWDVLHENTNSALGGSSKAQKESGDVFKRRGKPLNGWSEADKKIPLEYQMWCASWAEEWLRVLKPGGSCFIFAGRRYAHRCIVALEDAGFTFKDMIAWEKNTAAHRAQRISKVFDRRNDTENSERWDGWRVANLRPLFEPILWFQKPYKTGQTLTDNVLTHGVGAWNENALKKYNISNTESELFSNILKVETNSDDTGKHVTQKPLNLMKLLVELVTQENQIVLDPFAGSATTCVAAKQLNRDFIGFEANQEIYNVARERLEESTTQQSLNI